MTIASKVKDAARRVAGDREYPAELRSQGFSIRDDLKTIAAEPELKKAAALAHANYQRVEAAVKAGDVPRQALQIAAREIDLAAGALSKVGPAKQRAWNWPPPDIADEKALVHVDLTDLRRIQGGRLGRIDEAKSHMEEAERRIATAVADKAPLDVILGERKALHGMQSLVADHERLASRDAAKIIELEKRREQLKRAAWGLEPEPDGD